MGYEIPNNLVCFLLLENTTHSFLCICTKYGAKRQDTIIYCWMVTFSM